MRWLPFQQYYLIYNISLDTFPASIKYSLPMKCSFNTYSGRVRTSPLLFRFWLTLVKWSFFVEHHLPKATVLLSSNKIVCWLTTSGIISSVQSRCSYTSPLKGLYARNTSLKKSAVCGVERISSDRLESCNMLDKDIFKLPNLLLVFLASTCLWFCGFSKDCGDFGGVAIYRWYRNGLLWIFVI